MLPTPPASPKPFVSCNPEDRLNTVLGGRYQLTDILGLGAYGTVYKAQDVHTGVEYAVKALNRLGLDSRQAEFQDREIRLHYYATQHGNVVSMEQILESPECIYVVLEYCPEGDLFSKITEDCDYVGRDFKARTVFLQILDAVQHCHSRGIYHRDLKPENILVKDNGWNVKLADFGLATEDRITSDFGCGSTFYMSPECQQTNPKQYACYASEPNDIWSLGVILVNLVCGRNPWKRAALDDSTFRAYMRDRNFLQSILPISSGLNAILQRIFEVNPKNRIGLDELRQLIQTCPQLSSEPEDPSLPPSPPESPVERSVDSPMAFFGNISLDPVPQMEPLPGQQFPHLYHHFHSPRAMAYNTPVDLPTPPDSVHGSPQHSPYTYHVKPDLATTTFNNTIQGRPQQQAAPQQPANYMHSLQSWSRCANNFVPNFAGPFCWGRPLVV